jgi:hypothetical protein
MKRIFPGLLLCAAALIGPSKILAQNPPAGAIFDLAVAHPGPVSTAESLFTVGFTAATTNTFISFAFREVPAYWALDDTSVVLNGTSTNLLANPGFESASIGQNIPTGWSRWIQPIDVSAIGVITNGGSCSADLPTHSPTLFWCDGSVEGYDAVYQQIPTTVGQAYTISWWLGHNTGAAPVFPTIDMLVYATTDLPVGTIQLGGVPEPATWTMMGAGMLLMAFIAHKRRQTARS